MKVARFVLLFLVIAFVNLSFAQEANKKNSAQSKKAEFKQESNVANPNYNPGGIEPAAGQSSGGTGKKGALQSAGGGNKMKEKLQSKAGKNLDIDDDEIDGFNNDNSNKDKPEPSAGKEKKGPLQNKEGKNKKVAPQF